MREQVSDRPAQTPRVVLAHVRFISLRDLPLLYDIIEGLVF